MKAALAMEAMNTMPAAKLAASCDFDFSFLGLLPDC